MARMCYNMTRHRGIAQLVEQWSPKPRVLSSSLSAPASLKTPFFTEFFVFNCFETESELSAWYKALYSNIRSGIPAKFLAGGRPELYRNA